MKNYSDHESHDSLSFINNKAFPLELYSICRQYLSGLAQIKRQPATITDIIYQHMPLQTADNIAAFLESKNVTSLRYQRLLELNPGKAQLYISAMMTLDCYNPQEDDAVKGIPYVDFLNRLNRAIMRLFRESAEGINFSANLPDLYKELAQSLEADELYGTWYRAEKKAQAETLYLSMHSEKWLNHEALVEEKITLGKFAATDNAIIYEDGEAVAQVCTSIKPVGYGNSDKYTWTFRHGKELSGSLPNENTALFDALEQLDVDGIDAATFTLLRDMSKG